MHGKFYSYRPERAANGELGPSGNGYLGTSVLGELQDGNVWLYGRPRKGEGVQGWIKRQVVDALESAPMIDRRAVTDGQGFIIIPAYRVKPWWQRRDYDVYVRWAGLAGEYEVSVMRYDVDLVKH